MSHNIYINGISVIKFFKIEKIQVFYVAKPLSFRNINFILMEMLAINIYVYFLAARWLFWLRVAMRCGA